jgi:hypothetical protein
LVIDLPTVIQYLNAVSAIAVTLGVFFVVFQLRQNARLIEASNKQIEVSNKQVEANLRQVRQEVILSIVERFTEDSFILKRKRIRDIVRKRAENGWKDFLESDDDYEVRGFLGLYDSTGYLAKNGIADVKMIADGMGFLVVYDWEAMEPVIKYYFSVWQRDSHTNFRWLRDEVKKSMDQSGT